MAAMTQVSDLKAAAQLATLASNQLSSKRRRAVSLGEEEPEEMSLILRSFKWMSHQKVGFRKGTMSIQNSSIYSAEHEEDQSLCEEFPVLVEVVRRDEGAAGFRSNVSVSDIISHLTRESTSTNR